MKIKIRYYGKLAEITNKNEEFLFVDINTVGALKGRLSVQYPELEKFQFQLAQDNTIVDENQKLNGSAVDLLPPFSGG